MSKEEVIDWIVCGRAIGSASGWDQSDTFELMLYDFVPSDGVKIPEGTVTFSFENGTVRTWKDDGDVAWQADLIDTIKDAPIARTD